MPSVIIPAHNESALIADCVRSVLADGIEDLEIIVIANACKDDTAERARAVSPAVRVIETATPGKTNAINLGERGATRFPRVFLDGDIVLRPGALRSLLATLGDDIHLASPPPEFTLERSSWGVRRFYRALECNDYFGKGAPNGSGTFALSEQGRKRWGEFPNIVADDGFVGLHFTPAEKATSPGPGAIVRPPIDLPTLIRIKARARLGTRELLARFPELADNRTRTGGSTLRRLALDPRRWADLLVYVYVRVAERIMERRLARRGGPVWLRDEGSRSTTSTGSGAGAGESP